MVYAPSKPTTLLPHNQLNHLRRVYPTPAVYNLIAMAHFLAAYQREMFRFKPISSGVCCWMFVPPARHT